MKLLDLDWREVFDLLPRWEALRIEQRRFLIQRSLGGYRARTRDDELIDLGWLEAVPAKNNPRYTVPHARRFWLKLIRELSRATPFPDQSAAARDAGASSLQNYLLQHYTAAEISRLYRRRRTGDRNRLAHDMGRVDWWRQFLDWNRGPDDDDPSLDDDIGDHDHDDRDEPGDGDERLRTLLETSVDALHLSVRSSTCLRNASVDTIGDLTRKREEEIAKARNVGRLTLAEIRNRLQERGLGLGMTDDDYNAARRRLATAESVDSEPDAPLRRGPLDAHGRWQQAPPTAVATARELIAAVMANDGPIAITDLLEAADESSRRDLLAAGLSFAFREALLLIAVDAVLLPFVGIWQPILKRLQRGRLTAPAEGAFAVGELLSRPFLIEDMTALLMEAIAEPPRLKAGTRSLFERSVRAIGRALSALPAWVTPESASLSPDQRLAHATRVAFELRLAAEHDDSGAKLVVTARGRQWLVLPVKERLKRMLDLLRDDAVDRSSADPYSFDPWDPQHAETAHLSFLPRTYGSAIRYYANPERGVIDAFRAIGRASTIDLQSFIEFHSEERNPLLDESARILDYRLQREGCERLWARTLLTFLYDRLLPLGGAALGPLTDGGAGFSLTDVGRYLLGEVDDFELDAPEETGEAVIQPNFEIVFLSPSPIDQMRARTFAAPTAALKSPQSVGTLFVIERASVQRAVMAGQDAEQVIAVAGDLSKQPLPANVTRQIRDWAADVRWIDVRPAVVVDCGDAETAARVLSAVGKRGRLLGESVVELADGADLTPAVRRKLISRGVFVRS